MSSASNNAFWQVADLIPHRHSMLLLDQILAADDTSLWASSTPTEQLLSCWGIEFLGQATAAFFTLMQLSTNQTEQKIEPAAGMLIGSRRYHAYQPHIAPNRLLLMQVTPKTQLSGNPTLSGLVKFQGSLRSLTPNALDNLPLSTPPSRLPYDTASLAALEGDLLIEGDLSVYIAPQPPSANLS